jgi:hypothetical protein
MPEHCPATQSCGSKAKRFTIGSGQGMALALETLQLPLDWRCLTRR